MKFTHLHVHSHYSLLDGLSKIDELVGKAKSEGMKALALTDHGVMYGVIEFYQKCQAAGLKPIIGVETYIAPKGRHLKRSKVDEERYHLILLAKNLDGYKNLIQLTSKAHLEGYYYKPRIDWELLEEHHAGLIGLSACIDGEVPRNIINGKPDKAEETAKKYSELFGPDNFYLELQYHANIPEQAVANKGLTLLAKKLDLPLVATNDIHYLNAEDDEAQDVLLCLQTKKKREDKDRLNMMGEDFSFKSKKQMEEEFKDLPEVLENTQKIVEACNLELPLGQITLPFFETPDKKDPFEYLKELCQKGIARRFKGKLTKEQQDRLDYELGIIKKTGFAP